MFMLEHLIYVLPIGIGLYFFLIMIVKKYDEPVQQTACYCPECDNELISSGSFVSDEEYVVYQCSKCGVVSKWYFDAPVPILIEEKRGKHDHL